MGFKFQTFAPATAKTEAAPAIQPPPATAEAEEPKSAPAEEPGTIVSLDKFRKK